MPYIPSAGELKTKPTQHSVKELRSIGIQPDILMCRSDREVPASERRKIALFCNVREEAVIQALDVSSQSMMCHWRITMKVSTSQVLAAFGIDDAPEPDSHALGEPSPIRLLTLEGEVVIAIVGKYTGLKDAYKSLMEALVHGGIANHVRESAVGVD